MMMMKYENIYKYTQYDDDDLNSAVSTYTLLQQLHW